MGPQAAVQGRALVALGQQGATVAIGAQRLGWKEAGCGGIRRGTQRPTLQCAAKALREVIQGEQAFPFGDGVQRRPIRGLPEQVHADQGARSQPTIAPNRGNPPFQVRRVDLKGARIDIHEHRSGAQHQRNLGRRRVGEGRQEHGVAATDAFRHERDLDRIGAGTDSNAVLRPA